MATSIDKVLEVIRKKKIKCQLGSFDKEVKWISTGIFAIDWVLGGKGFPLGKVVEVYGDYSSGKSWFCYKLFSKIQKLHDVVGILVDTEGSFDKNWVSTAGVDVDKLLVLKPYTIEEVFEVLFDILKENENKLFVVWDSLAATPSEFELEEAFDKRDLSKAQSIGKGLRMLVRLMEGTQSSLVIVNQLREKIGQFFGETEYTPGGRALGYIASLRLKFSRKRRIKIGDNEVVGNEVRVECTKSKLFPPFRFVDLQFYFSKGIDTFSGAEDILIRSGIVQEAGSKAGSGWYTLVGSEKKYRRDDLLELFLFPDERLREVLVAALGERLVKEYFPVQGSQGEEEGGESD